MIRISNCINGETRIYGLKVFGLTFGAFALIIIWSKSSMIFGIMGGAFGYLIGDFFSKYWQRGRLQKQLYWHLSKHIPKNKFLPPSSSTKILL